MKMLEKYNQEQLEKEAAVVCRDFGLFCEYILDKKIKLAKNSGNIGKKDCFALNALLHVKENYERPTYTQDRYPLIQYFYYVAVKYRILKENSAGTTLQQGENYQNFRQASLLEQYLLLAVVFIFDGRFASANEPWQRVSTEVWQLSVDGLMQWGEEQKPQTGIRYWLSSRRYFYLWSMERVMFYMEALGMLRVWKRPEDESGNPSHEWEIEILPLFQMISELYEKLDEDGLEKWEGDLLQFCYTDFRNRLMPGYKGGSMEKMFADEETELAEQVIDLEVTVRYTSCIRVIRMNMSDSLYELHRMIQRAVAFDDDHPFEFSIGSGMWKRIYTLPETVDSEDELSVYEADLGNLKLRKGQKFTYLFDFGDEWWFDIRVLQIQDGSIEKAEVIKAVNEAPEQYPVYEEDSEW